MFGKMFGSTIGFLILSVLTADNVVAQESAESAAKKADSVTKVQLASPAETACFTGPAKLADEEISTFLGAPSALLSAFPGGGLPMSTRVRSLAGSDAATLEPLLGLVSSASPVQISAIGSGLARAARSCAVVNPEYAATIQEKVAALDNDDLEVAFQAAAQEVQTAAVGASGGAGTGAAAGGGAIGSGGVAGGGAAGLGGSSSVANTVDSFSVGARGGSFQQTDLISPN